MYENDDGYNENTCVVCFKNVDIFSIGDCDHPVCFECSTRMRVLCRQNECPICRQDLQKVIFTRNKQTFKQAEEAVGQKHILIDRKFQIVFGGPSIQQAYNFLLAHVCSVCPERRAFQSFVALRDHMRKEHELFYCDLCVDNLKILTLERRCYTRKELATHRRQGDPDNRSHRGHPLCEFCDKRYNDNDDLYRHLRRDHLFCHFCDADGLHQYYDSYDVLRDHFRDHHYLCEEGECFHEKFTPVFRSEIDLKAHRASVHGRQMGKLAAKQARTLELEFTLKPRQAEQRRGGSRSNIRHQRYADEEGAVGGVEVEYQSQQQQTQTPIFSKINTASNDEFPTLGGSATPAINHGAHFRKSGVTIRTGGKLAVNDEDFPALGPEATASVSLRVNSVSVADRAKTKPTNVSIHVNHHPNSVTLTSAKKDPFPALQANFPAFASHPTSAPSSRSSQWVSVKNKSTQPVTKNVQPKSSKSYRYDESDFPAQNDFPSLGGCVAPHIARLAATQWSSGKEPEPKLTVNKSIPSQLPPKPPQPKTFHIEDDFPSLNSRFGASCSVTPEPKPREIKPKKEYSISIPINTDSNKFGKSSGNVDNMSSDSDIGSKKSSKKKKSNTKTVKDSSSELGTTKSLNNNNNNEISKKNKQKDETKSKAKQIKVDEQAKKQSKAELPKSNKSQEICERKRSELKIENLNDQTQPDNKMDVNDSMLSSDDNRVPSGLTQEKPPVPPGFESTPAPPPGFSITLNSVARPPGNGLTFTSSSGQHYSIAPGDKNCNKKSFSYVSPPNIKNRNAELVSGVTTSLGSQKAFEDFLQMSALYRQSTVPAEIYYTHCRESMGEEAFNVIFPELLVLLPDIDKQQELWRVADHLRDWRLMECATCGQLMSSSDLKHHQAAHSLENHFPTLTNGMSGPNAWAKK